MSEELKDLLFRPNKDAVFMSDFDKYEDEVVHTELIGKRRVYSETAYNTIVAKCDRLQEALTHAMNGDLDPEDRVIIAQILAGEPPQKDTPNEHPQ